RQSRRARPVSDGNSLRGRRAGRDRYADSIARGWSPMELVVLGLIVLLVYVFIRLLAKFGAFLSDARYRAYRQLASLYHGRYESRGLSDPPTVSFGHNGSMVRVGLAPTLTGQPGQIPRTRVVARFRRGIPFRLELAPIARPAPPQAPKGTRLLR